MNKKIFDVSCAMSDMDDSLVSEAVCAEKPKRRMPWLAAAALVLVVGAAIALPKLIKADRGEISAQLPSDAAEATEAPASEPIGNYVEEDATAAPISATEEPKETPVPTQQTATQVYFASVEALNMAVRSGRYGINGPLEGLTAIYMPTKVPYGAELDDISVTADSVIVTYKISEEWIHSEDDPNRFVLVWHRNWLAGSAESIARSLNNEIFGEDDVHYSNGVWIFSAQGSIERVAVWEYEGCGFEIVTPGYYCSDSDTLSFTGIARVELGGVEAHAPSEGFVNDGYMWLSENDMGYAPLTSLAYTTSYYKPEDGGEGRMVITEGMAFLDCLGDDMRTYEQRMRAFPHVGFIFEPVFLENTELVEIDVYNVKTLEPMALSIGLDELYEIAEGKVSPEMQSIIFGENSGCILVDMVITHRGNYIAELDEYETEAYHCGFILEAFDEL